MLMCLSDNAATRAARAPEHTRNLLAVHAVHDFGTHTPLPLNAKDL
jgi:hypothetical protein